MESGLIVGCEKVKALNEGGKQYVTVGPYQDASGWRGHAMITTGKRPSAHSTTKFNIVANAAQCFIDYVGNEAAWIAANEALAKNGQL